MATPREQLNEDMKGLVKALRQKEKDLASRIAKGKFLLQAEKDPAKIEAMQQWELTLTQYQHLYEAARIILEQSGILVWDKEDVGFMYVTKVSEWTLEMVKAVQERGGVVVNFTSTQEASGPVAQELSEPLLL